MYIDPSVIPVYLKTLRAELEQAMNAEGIFADGNGLVYLSEAIEAFEDGQEHGFDHSVMREQTWNAVSTLTPGILQSEPLSPEIYGKITKLFWVTNLHQTASHLERIDDQYVRENLQGPREWLRYVLGIS